MKIILDTADLAELVVCFADDRMNMKLNDTAIKWSIDGKPVSKPNVVVEFEINAEADYG